MDNAISRLTSISDNTGTLESLSYLGLSTIVIRSYPQPGTELTYVKLSGESNGDAGDQYTGLDRFGRVVDQRWIITATGTATDRFQYGYDRDGNRLYRKNLVNSNFSELYHANGPGNDYDNLNQLTNFARGVLNSSNDTISSPTHSISWSFDALGNWTSTATDGGGPVSNAFNKQNEETAAGNANLAFDNNGNTTTDQNGHTLIFDAWNRLVQVKNGSTVLETYGYDARGWRITENPGTVRDLYYSMLWQLLEEDVGGSMQDQYVWSPVYIDAMIERDTPTQRLYAQQDADFNVTALVDTSGNVQERYIYDPYGSVTILTPSWSTRGSSSFGWVFLHQGGRLDNATGFYAFRYRDYSPALGRWIENDPLQFTAGDNNFYRYEANGPIYGADPVGQDNPNWFPWGMFPKGPSPPPGAPGQGLPVPPNQYNPGGLIYYPPQAYKPGLNQVAIISDTTCARDRFCWVPGNQHHTGVGTYEALAAALNQYDDNSIDVLILSGNTGGRCNCATSNSVNDVYLGGPNMPPEIYALIQRKLKKPGGEVIIASCNAGSTWQNKPGPGQPPNDVQETADKCKCPITACPKGTNGQHPGNYSGGGSGDAPWITVPNTKK